jgi:hypothetical protein
MAAILKLVTPVTTMPHPRPYSTYYYESLNHKEADYMRIGRACTIKGAIKAAIGRIIDGTCQAADIYGESGVRMYQIRAYKDRIVIHGLIT